MWCLWRFHNGSLIVPSWDRGAFRQSYQSLSQVSPLHYIGDGFRQSAVVSYLPSSRHQGGLRKYFSLVFGWPGEPVGLGYLSWS
jgi:hypothetical protein